MASEKKYLNLESVAARYDLKERTLRDWIFRGKVRASKIGRRWFIATAELERIFEDGEYIAFGNKAANKR